MLSRRAPRQRGRLLKLRAFNIPFEILAVGGRNLLRSKLLVKASGLSKPQKCPLGKVTGTGGTFLEDARIFVFVWIRPRVLQSQAGPGEARALC